MRARSCEKHGNDTDPIYLVESIHVQLTHKARELVQSVQYGVKTRLVHQTHVVVLEVRPEYRPAELTHVRHDKAAPIHHIRRPMIRAR
jgi:hypothetical protein